MNKIGSGFFLLNVIFFKGYEKVKGVVGKSESIK